jgi:hypothetical protein
MILTLAEAAVLLIKQLGPVLNELRQSSELTPEQEAELDARIAALRDQVHWKVD